MIVKQSFYKRSTDLYSGDVNNAVAAVRKGRPGDSEQWEGGREKKEEEEEARRSQRMRKDKVYDDPSFIVLTETKFSFRCIPVWDRYSPHRTRVEKKKCDNALTMTSPVHW